MSDIIKTIQAKLAALTLEQREQFTITIAEQGLEAALAEVNLTPADEEKEALYQMLQQKTGELTDEELEQVAGGSGFSWCPRNHFEFWFPGTDCRYCGQFTFTKEPWSFTCGYFKCTADKNSPRAVTDSILAALLMFM